MFTKSVTVDIRWADKQVSSEGEEVHRLRLQNEVVEAPPAEQQDRWRTPSGLMRELYVKLLPTVIDRIGQFAVAIGEKEFRWDQWAFLSEWERSEHEGRVLFAPLRSGLFLVFTLSLMFLSPLFLFYSQTQRIPLLAVSGFLALVTAVVADLLSANGIVLEYVRSLLKRDDGWLVSKELKSYKGNEKGR